jgi:hypothetical protein
MTLFANAIIYLHATFFIYTRSEETLIEYTQDFLLIFMIAIAFLTAYKRVDWREFFVFIGVAALIMLLREQNNWFKAEVFRGAWQLCVVMVLVPFLFWLNKNKHKFFKQLKQFDRLHGIPAGVIGLMILLVFSRLIGKKEIWQGVMGEDYIYGVKMVMEESVELLGYSLMTAGLIILAVSVILGKFLKMDD